MASLRDGTFLRAWPVRLVSSISILGIGAVVHAAQLGATAQAVIPATARQIISVNYHRLAIDPAAQQVSSQVLPKEMQNLAGLLTLGGVKPAEDLNRLTFATYAGKDGSIGMIGLAEGTFMNLQLSKFFMKTPKQPNPPQFQGVDIYTSQGLTFFEPDQTTLVFGSRPAIEMAINTEQGANERLNQNSNMTGLIDGTQTTDVWSVLDAAGARSMIRGMIGSSFAGLDPATIEKRFNGARYTIDFQGQIQLNLQLMTSDSLTAATVSTGLGMAIHMRQQQEPDPNAKAVLNQIQVDSSGDDAFLQVSAPEASLAALMHTDVFQSIIH